MTIRPLQNPATDIAVFGLSVALLGFMTKMVRDVTSGALADVKAPALLPAITRHTYTAAQIFARAKEYFGTTTSPDEAGYILPDGTMLDFSGETSAGIPILLSPFKERVLDHRDIAFAWPEDDSPGGFEAMKQVMNWGAIRLSTYHETVAVNLAQPLTETQKKTIDQALRYNPDAVLVVEVDDSELNQIGYREFTHPFTNWRAFIKHTLEAKRVSPQTFPLPRARRTDLEKRVHQVIDNVQKTIDETKKSASVKRIERVLDTSDVERFIVGADDLREAIADYQAIEREGLTPEEYQEEKEAAFEAIAEAVDGLDIDEDALEEIEEQPTTNELRRKSIDILDRLIKDKVRQMLPAPSLSDARKAVYKDILDGFSTVQEVKEYIEGMPEDSVLFTARGDEIPFSLIRIIISDIEKNPWLSPFRPEQRPDTSWQPPLIPETRITYYTVSFQGDTTFKAGEIVSEQAFKTENEKVMKLDLRPARGWVTSKGELLSWGNGRRPVKELEEYLPASIPRDDLMRIADKYSWWAAKLAEAVCPHNDVACVEREARRLAEARRARLE